MKAMAPFHRFLQLVDLQLQRRFSRQTLHPVPLAIRDYRKSGNQTRKLPQDGNRPAPASQ